jgi:spore coat protein U-like protein
MNRHLKLALAAALAAFALHTDDALAFTSTTGTLTVTAAIGTSCTVTNVGINFGTIVTTSAVTTSGILNVNCSNGLAFSLDLDPGLNPAAANANRQLASGANRINYNIYTNNTFTTVWGSAMAGGTSQSFTGTGANQSITAFLKIPVQAAPPTGTYADTVAITAVF